MPSVKNVSLCDPDTLKPFPSFKHNTTTYVGIPHGGRFAVQVQWGEPFLLCVNSGDSDIICRPASEGKALIDITDERAPQIRRQLPELVQALFTRERRRPQRLYAFSVVIKSDAAGHPVLSSYEYHVLCPSEFDAALACKLAIDRNPKDISPELICDRVEGNTCPQCHEVRKKLG
ncbi:MAG TPA: hypothetical protein V6D22_07785 [Candidatus Obscuribacterales bacterium]